MRKIWVISAATAVVAAGTFAMATVEAQDAATQAPLSSEERDARIAQYESAIQAQTHEQPIAFPHNVHSAYGIDCQYCHFSVERSPSAGIPPVSTCAGCHQAGKVAGNSEYAQSQISMVQEYINSGEAIPWVRIHKVAEHVKFPHHRHINAGLDCSTCHGDVEQVGVWVEPDPAWGNGKMGWCISCHVEREVNRDCTTCHY